MSQEGEVCPWRGKCVPGGGSVSQEWGVSREVEVCSRSRERPGRGERPGRWEHPGRGECVPGRGSVPGGRSVSQERGVSREVGVGPGSGECPRTGECPGSGEYPGRGECPGTCPICMASPSPPRPHHSPARSRMTWSSRGSSEKCGIRLAHSTRVKSCLSAAWQMLVTGSFGCRGGRRAGHSVPEASVLTKHSPDQALPHTLGPCRTPNTAPKDAQAPIPGTWDYATLHGTWGLAEVIRCGLTLGGKPAPLGGPRVIARGL